jgi:hypothetical protein
MNSSELIQFRDSKKQKIAQKQALVEFIEIIDYNSQILSIEEEITTKNLREDLNAMYSQIEEIDN